MKIVTRDNEKQFKYPQVIYSLSFQAFFFKYSRLMNNNINKWAHSLSQGHISLSCIKFNAT